MRKGGRLSALGAALAAAWLAWTSTATAQLVIDGETIADAKTFDGAKAEGRLLAYGTYPTDAMKPMGLSLRGETHFVKAGNAARAENIGRTVFR